MVECPLIETVHACIMPPNGALVMTEFFQYKHLRVTYIPPGMADDLEALVVYMDNEGAGTPWCLGGPQKDGPPVIIFYGLKSSIQDYRYFVHMLVVAYTAYGKKIQREAFSMRSVAEGLGCCRGINARNVGVYGTGLRSMVEVDCQLVRQRIQQAEETENRYIPENEAKLAALKWLVSKEVLRA